MLITAKWLFDEYFLTGQARVLCKVTVKIQIWHIENILDAIFQLSAFLLIIDQHIWLKVVFSRLTFMSLCILIKVDLQLLVWTLDISFTFQKGRRTIQTANFINSYHLSSSF